MSDSTHRAEGSDDERTRDDHRRADDVRYEDEGGLPRWVRGALIVAVMLAVLVAIFGLAGGHAMKHLSQGSGGAGEQHSGRVPVAAVRA